MEAGASGTTVLKSHFALTMTSLGFESDFGGLKLALVLSGRIKGGSLAKLPFMLGPFT